MKHYFIAAAAGLVLAIAAGFLWSWLIWFIPVNLIIAPGLGLVIAEAISLAVNRKRSVGLAVIGGAAMLLSYLTEILIPWGMGFHGWDIAAVIIGVIATVSILR